MKKNISPVYLLFLTLGVVTVLSSCAPAPAAQPTGSEDPGKNTEDAVQPEPEIISSVSVDDQDLPTDTVVVKEAVANEPSWVTIHIDSNGTFGEVIGYTLLSKGSNPNVIVKIDSTKATDTLYAMLHFDRGNSAIYEFPGVDEPVSIGGNIILQAFKVKKPVSEPKPIEEPKPAEQPKAETKSPSQPKTQPQPAQPKVEPIKEEEPKPQTKSFTIIAKQFSFEPASIEVNEGDTVQLTIKSTDVDHGFALSEFGVNQVIAKDQTATVNFVANKKGTYTFFCSVYCGSGHNDMKGTLTVK